MTTPATTTIEANANVASSSATNDNLILGLVIGLIGLCCCLILLFGIFVFFLRRQRRRQNAEKKDEV
jgi:hypothetical protein